MQNMTNSTYIITNITRSTNITALCLQETWLSDESITSIYNIPGYSMFSKGKTCTNHGGLITCVNDAFSVNIIENTCNMTNWECLSVEIFNNDTPDDISVIHNVYNKPYDTVVNFELFIDEFKEFMSINPHSEQTYMLGDFNIDLLKISSNHRYDIFFNILLADGYLPCITLPTRIDRTFTLIDNIYATSNFNND